MPAAVAAPNDAAAQAGAQVAAAGGNAVDVAVAAMLTAMTTEPGIVSSMGSAFITVWPPGAEPEVVDGNVVMAGRGRPEDAFGVALREVTTGYGGGVTLLAGHGSVAVPGAWAGLGTAHGRHGRLPWAQVLTPAATVARRGFPVGKASATYLAFVAEEVYGWCRESRSRLLPGGVPVREGQVVADPELAATYEHLGTVGWQDAYTGELARRLVADMDAHGGLVSAEDLAGYEAVVRPPLRVPIGDWDLATNPPPSVGGPMLALMLGGLVERGGSDWLDVIAVQQAVLGYRASEHDLSPDLEGAGWAALRRAQRYGLAGLPTSPNTAHVSVVDGDGGACAITASSGYGSGVVVPGTGLQLNNCLGELELNRLGVHALPPGTPMASNMAPTVGRAADGRVLAIGSPGADRITTALMQVIAQGCLRGEELVSAIAAPRVHVRVGGGPPGGGPGGAAGDVVEHESDPGIAAAVAAGGLPGRDHGVLSMYFGGVAAAYRGEDERLIAAGDPRRAGAALVA